MQKKVIATLISSAFAGFAGVASAGPISVASVKTYAAEALCPLCAAAAPLTINSVAYSLTSPWSANTTVVTTLALDSGSISACPTLTVLNAASATVTSAGVASGTPASTCTYTIAVGASPVNANATVQFTGGVVTAPSSLANDGGTLNVTVAVSDTGGNVVESNNAVLARSANAWSVSAVSSSTLTTPEQSRVNVASTPNPLTAFVDGTNDVTPNSSTTRTINLGRVRTTANAGTQLLPDGTTSFDFDSATDLNWSLTVTGNFATGSTVFLASNATCSASIVNFTLNTGLTSGTVSVDATALGVTGDDTNANVYVCYTAGATTTTVIPTAQFAVSGSMTPTYGGAPTTAATKDLASTSLYTLSLNGSRIDVRNYVPNAFAGWFSAYRIINTGLVAATVRGQFIGQDGALVGTAQDVTASIPAGGVVVINSADVEAILGAASAPGGVGPRLRLTAPTDSLRVQAFACQPSGPCFLNTDAMAADDGGGAK